MIDLDALIDKTFLAPFRGKKHGNIGVELEFPLINLKKAPVDEKIAKGAFGYFLEDGFEVEIEENGEIFFISNKDGDCLSFDNSYNNFEFSMNYGNDLEAIEKRFYALHEKAQGYFNKNGHTLVGLGTNPNKKYITQSHVNFSTYNMVDEYLHRFGKSSPYPDFPAYLSSAQTHLDVPIEFLPRAYTLFSKLDFVRGLLFSNSPDFEGAGYLCYRDFLWEQSAFSLCPNITGKVDGVFETEKDIIEYIAQKGIFNRIRNGKYEVFEPVPMRKYFAREDALEEDINCYLSFKNVEITRRGTLEIRSDCAQPFEKAFAPAKFNLGILNNMEKAEKRLERFFEETGINEPNSSLREKAVRGEMSADERQVNELISDMMKISENVI